MKLSNSKFILPELIPIFSITMLCALIITHGIPPGHDIKLHLPWIDGFADSLTAGVLYPRWLMNMDEGLGSPVFYYYPPIPYYISGVLSLLIEHKPYIDNIFLSSVSLSLIVGATGFYFSMRVIVPRSACAMGALLYAAIPYTILIDFSWRAAYAELWGIAFLPWLFYPALLLAKPNARRRILVLSAIFTALLLCSHPPTALLGIPTAAITAMLITLQRRNVLNGAIYLAGVGLGFGLAAPYLVPTFALEDLINRQKFMFDMYPIEKRMFTKSWSFGFQTFMSTLRNVTTGTFLFTSILLAIIIFRGSGTARRAAAIALLVVLVMFFMMFKSSAFLWDFLPLLKRLQFPYRLNVLISIFAAGAAAACHQNLGFIGRIMLWGAVGLVWLAAVAFLANDRTLSRNNITTILFEAGSPPEYRLFGRTAERRRASVTSGQGDVKVHHWKGPKIIAVVHAETPLTVVFRQHAFPLWHASHRAITVVDNPASGLLTVELPAGSHKVSLRLMTTRAEKIGLAVGALSLILLGAITWTGLTPSDRTPSTRVRTGRAPWGGSARTARDPKFKSRPDNGQTN